MTRGRRLTLLLITVFPVLVLLIASAVYLRRQFDLLAGQSNVLIAGELQRRFNKHVSIGSARISQSVIVLQDIRVSRGPEPASGDLISIPGLFIHYDWRGLVLRGQGAQAVRDIVAMRPKVLLIRRPDGTFNITDLLKPPPGPARPPFRGQLKINGGEVEFVDYAVVPGQNRPSVFLRNLKGALDASHYPIYSFSGTTTGTAGQFSSAVFKGRYYSVAKRTLVDVRAGGVAAPMVMPYAWKSRDVQVLGGKLDLSTVLDERKADKRFVVTLTGRVRVHDAVVGLKFLRIPAKGVSGDLVLAGDSASGNVTGSLADTTLRVTGSFTHFKNPALNLHITSSSADYPTMIASTTFLGALSQFSPSGRGPASATITGSLASPMVDVTARVPRAAIRGVAVSSVAVSARYSRSRVDIRSVTLAAKGASLSGRGYVTTGPSAVMDLKGTFANFKLSQIPKTVGFPITGVASGSFSLSGPTANPSVTASIHATNGVVSGTAFSTADASVQLVGTRVDVRSLKVGGVAGGSLQAFGSVSASSVNLTTSATSIDIAQVGKLFGETGYSGRAFFAGRVTGSPRSPQVDGTLEVFEAEINGQTIDHALISFSGNRHSATINDALVQVFPADARFTGELTGLDTNRISFSGKGSAQRLEVAKLLDLLNSKAKVSGTVLGDVTFSGVFLPHVRKGAPKFVGVVASGDLSVEDAFAFDYPISSAAARLDYSNNVLRVTDASVVSDKAKLTLSGTLATDTYEVKAGFDLSGFDLTRLHEYLGDYLVLAGTAAASGTFSGTWDNLQSNVSARVDDLAVNYERFDSAQAGLTYADGKYTGYSISLVRGSQRFDLSGTDYDPDTACLASLKGAVQDVSIPDIWSILRASPYFSTAEGRPTAQKLDKFPKVVSGRVNGSFSLSGCLDAPDGSVSLSATNIGLDVEKIESVDLQATSKAGVVTIGKLRAVSGDMTVDVAGAPAYDNGNLNVEIRAENVRLSRLEPWLGKSTPGGTLSALFLVRGPASAPDIRGSAEVVKPSFDGIVLDQLRTSTIQITANRIEIPDILLTAGGYQASASASVPWSWAAAGVPNDEPIHLSVDLSTQNLAVLKLFGPIVDVTKTTGTISEAWFRMDGTLLDPQLSGSVKVANGAIAFTGFANTFANANIDLGFVGDRLVVNSLSAASSLGGTVYVVPGGYVTAGILGPSEINLQVVADRLKLAERNALGLREDVSAQIDAGLSISGPLASPTVADRAMGPIAGGIALSHSRISFQLMSKNALWQAAPPINPLFNVSLRLGQDVVVSPPSMTLTVTGGGALTGSLAQPVVKGIVLDVLSGGIGLATARLRIIPGGRIYITYAPPAAPDVQVDLQATASVFAVNSLRQRQRYQITMNITGQAANPQISLSSSPPGLTREQMLAGLGHLPSLFASPETGLQQELGSVLTAAGATALFAPIENLLIQKLGFEQFTLEFSPMYPLSIYVSRQLFGNYYLSFYRQLRGALASTQEAWYRVMFSYRRGLYELSVGADDEQTLYAQIGYAKAFW